MTNQERVMVWSPTKWPHLAAFESCIQRGADPLFDLNYWIETYRLQNGHRPEWYRQRLLDEKLQRMLGEKRQFDSGRSAMAWLTRHDEPTLVPT